MMLEVEDLPARVIACPDCGEVQELPELHGTGKSECWRCRCVLERASGRSLDAALACSLTTLLLLFPGNTLTLFRVSAAGLIRESRLGSGIPVIWSQGWPLLAVAIAIQGVLLPFFRFGLLTAALGAIRLHKTYAWIGPAFRWAERLDPWAMPDVFLFGCAIGYSRIAPFVPIEIDAGGWCFIGAAFMSMMTRASLDRQAIWKRIAAPEQAQGEAICCLDCLMILSAARQGEACPRCGARLWRRKSFSLPRSLALVMAGYLLYPVANIYPMTVDYQLGMPQEHRIIDGVRELIQAHLWPLAVVIFTASIAIPLLKLAGLTWFFISVYRGSSKALVTKTKLYRIIDAIGRWSNIDVFTIAAFAPLMQVGQLLNVVVFPGAPAFLTVVVVSMFAAQAFDPRLIWDAARA
ncbi:MAG: paraquat-inducible protein A [Acetobacteraceae bacterium]|nr:paraquat-inducible protein A [Acetobacteraceae bacterium]